MMEDGAFDMLEAGEEAAEEAVEDGLSHGDIAALGLGGGIAGMAVYQGAKALRSKTSGSQDKDQDSSDTSGQPKDPHLAHVKLKLAVYFQTFLFSHILSLLCCSRRRAILVTAPQAF